MTYPLINGAAINEADSTAAGTASLKPTSIGTTLLAMSYQASSLSPVTITSLLGRYQPASLSPVSIGMPALIFPPALLRAESLTPVLIGTTGLTRGQPPSSTAYDTQSINPATIGVPSFAGMFQIQPQSISPANLSSQSLQFSYAAASFPPGSIGQAGISSRFFAGSSVQPVTFGRPSLSWRFPALSFPVATIGPAQISLGAVAWEAASLEPVKIGDPGATATGFVAYSLRPVRLGIAMLDRGASC